MLFNHLSPKEKEDTGLGFKLFLLQMETFPMTFFIVLIKENVVPA